MGDGRGRSLANSARAGQPKSKRRTPIKPLLSAPTASNRCERLSNSQIGQTNCTIPAPTKKTPKSVYSSKCILTTAKCCCPPVRPRLRACESCSSFAAVLLASASRRSRGTPAGSPLRGMLLRLRASRHLYWVLPVGLTCVFWGPRPRPPSAPRYPRVDIRAPNSRSRPACGLFRRIPAVSIQWTERQSESRCPGGLEHEGAPPGRESLRGRQLHAADRWSRIHRCLPFAAQDRLERL
jgi:hypothetical protein